MRIALACLTVAVFYAVQGPALADRRVALVIGNSDYTELPDLANPSRDASAMAAALEGLGFDVTHGVDVGYRQLTGLVREFSRDLTNADVALVYYAGHGVQFAGENYLLPIDAALEHPNDLDFDAVRLSALLSRMERNGIINIILLDSCRDNPLLQRWSSGATRGLVLGEGGGMIQTPGPIGTLVFFATQPHGTAADGEAGHSPFTEALLEHIERPGLEIADLVREVRRDVATSTANAQVPWDQSSLTDRFFFVPPPEEEGAAAVTLPEPRDPDGGDRPTADIVFWESVRDSDHAGDFEAYLERFPDGTFAVLARMRLDRLSEAAASAQIDVASLESTRAVAPRSIADAPHAECVGRFNPVPPVADGPRLQPHRTSYVATLDGQVPGINGATGRLDYTLDTDCEAWTVAQELEMTLFLSNGGQRVYRSDQQVVESRDGRSLTIRIEDREDGATTARVEGHALFDIAGQPGRAEFVEPRAETLDLPRDALFPAAHQQALLDRAHAGETTFTALVFSGQPGDGAERAVARIISQGPPTVAGIGAGSLAPERSWIIDVTFLKLNDPTAPPTRRSTYRLFESGVMDDIRVERDGLTLQFDLQSVQYLESPCP